MLGWNALVDGSGCAIHEITVDKADAVALRPGAGARILDCPGLFKGLPGRKDRIIWDGDIGDKQRIVAVILHGRGGWDGSGWHGFGDGWAGREGWRWGFAGLGSG